MVLVHCRIHQLLKAKPRSKQETHMRKQLVWMLAMTSIMTAARAQDVATEVVQQVSATQAHLREMSPPSGKPASATPLLARLVGKMLSEQFKDVRVDLEPDMGPTNATMAPIPGALHLNRRAEICFDNYRVGFKREGVVMRYELSF